MAARRLRAHEPISSSSDVAAESLRLIPRRVPSSVDWNR